jgi:hypothetical protein
MKTQASGEIWSFPAGRVLWFAKGTNCGVVNVGTQRYRQVAVELK